MIRLETINQERNHFVIYACEPVRIEVMKVNGNVHAHVYRGDEVDREQEPLGAYDGSLGTNTDWEG